MIKVLPCQRSNPRPMHKPSECNNGNGFQQYLFWVLKDYRVQQPRTSSPTSTSAATLTYFYRSRRERCYHRNKENAYTFWNTNARYCIPWEYAELLIEFRGWRGDSGGNDNFQRQYQRDFQWQ